MNSTKDRKGILDLDEFTQGSASKYKINLETQTDGIKEAKDLAPGPDLFRKEVASQKEAKERRLQQQ
jgi:hypothetical protein